MIDMKLTGEEFDLHLNVMKRRGMIEWDGTKDGNIALTKQGKQMIKNGSKLSVEDISNIVVKILYDHDKILQDDIFECLIIDYKVFVDYDKFIKALIMLHDNNIMQSEEN